MYCVITDKGEIVGVMVTRNIEEEGRWGLDTLKKLQSPTGVAIYKAEELKGFEGFTKIYGFQLLYDDKGRVVKTVDAQGNDFPEGSLYALDTTNYPELIDALDY